MNDTHPQSDSALPPGIAVHHLLDAPLTLARDQRARILDVSLAPGVVEPLHTHGGDEFLLPLAGTGTVRVEDDQLPLVPGQPVRVPAGARKALRNTSEQEVLRVLAFLVLDAGRPAYEPVTGAGRLD